MKKTNGEEVDPYASPSYEIPAATLIVNDSSDSGLEKEDFFSLKETHDFDDEKVLKCIKQLNENLKNLTDPASPWYYAKNKDLQDRIFLEDLQQEFKRAIEELEYFQKTGQLKNPEEDPIQVPLRPGNFARVKKDADMMDTPRTMRFYMNEKGDVFVSMLTNSKKADGTKDPVLSGFASGTSKRFKKEWLISSSHGPLTLAKIRLNDKYKDDLRQHKEFTQPVVFEGSLDPVIAQYYIGEDKYGGFIPPKDPDASEGTVGCTLDNYLDKEGITIEIKNKLAKDFITALDNMHNETGLAHLDLKPNNLLVIMDPSGNPTLKIFDFGSVKPLGKIGTKVPVPGYASPEVFKINQNTRPSYQHPENFLGGVYSQSQENTTAGCGVVTWRDDAWSAAIILIELYIGIDPYDNVELLLRMVNNWPITAESDSTLQYYVSFIPPTVADVVFGRMLSTDPSVRAACPLSELKKVLQELNGSPKMIIVQKKVIAEKPEVLVGSLESLESFDLDPDELSNPVKKPNKEG